MRNQSKPPLRERIARAMIGRSGPDRLYTASLWTAVILLVIGLILAAGGLRWSPMILRILAFALLAWSIFRCFSRNVAARRRENGAFCRITGKIKSFFSLKKQAFRERKTHVFRRCPKCRNTLRLPRTPGEHTVRCPACGERFSLKIR